jgi:UDP-2,3-diacylglucosamine pyrophosphatase LpxH
VALKMKLDGVSWPELEQYIADHSSENVEGVCRWIRRQPEWKNRSKVTTAPAAKLVPPTTKIEVSPNYEPSISHIQWDGLKKICFAVVSDTHINSKYTQLSYLHQFYDICRRRDITDIFHAGDIDEGDQMRMGHQYECYHQGADEHRQEIIRVYPTFPGVKTHFITGNHDASILKRSGHDIGNTIAEHRPDMIYLGRDCADIYITPKCILRLNHPWDGSAYSISYKPQKAIDALSGGDKPNILVTGHYHKAEYLFYRNIHSIQAGTFCGQTPFMRGRGIAAMMGGWIIMVQVDDKGYIQHIIPEFIPFYKPIPDDYLNFQKGRI